MGCQSVALLDGGLAAWDRADYPIESVGEFSEFECGNFVANLNQADFVDATVVLAALDDATVCVLDARPAPRFNGVVEEPRPGLRRGHMPGALNLPFPELFNHGLLKSKPELEKIITPLIADSKRTICSCGSGVAACVLVFAAHHIGLENLAIYDGSWCEWGLPGELPVVTD